MSSLSICIPCLNGETTLAETLKSVSRQTRPADEIILGDNGSSDGSLEIMRRFQETHPSVRVISHPTPTGMASDWNRVIAEASSEWILLLPCDDILPENALALHAGLRTSKGVLTAGSKALLTAASRRLPGRIARLSPGQQDSRNLQRRLTRSAANQLGEPGAITFRKRAFDQVGGFDTDFRYYPDVDLWIRLLDHGTCSVTEEITSYFRIHGRSLTSGNRQIAYAEWRKLYHRYAARFDLAEQPTPSDEWKARRTGFLRHIVFNLLARF